VLEPCRHCRYQPEPGFLCIKCGASELDTHKCERCPYETGTVYELTDHNRTVHQTIQKAARNAR
jgi:hypothetical protein